MRQIKPIMKKDLKGAFRSNAIYLSLGGAALIFVVWSGNLQDMVTNLAENGVSGVQATAALTPVVNSIAVMFSFTLTVFFSMYVNGYAITMEKVKRSLESLLCTPAGLQGVWLGKALAVFLPSAIFGVGLTFLGLYGLSVAVIGPKLGALIMPGGAPLIASLLGIPAVAFPLILLVTGVQLILKNIRLINLAFLALIFGAGFGLSQSVKLSSSSWGLVGALLGIAAILGLLSFILSRFVTPERIVLSSKG